MDSANRTWISMNNLLKWHNVSSYQVLHRGFSEDKSSEFEWRDVYQVDLNDSEFCDGEIDSHQNKLMDDYHKAAFFLEIRMWINCIGKIEIDLINLY